MAVLTLQPAAAAGKDTYIDAANPTFNYGVSTTLGTRTGASIARTFIQFDLSSLPADVGIVSAVLTLTNIASSGGPAVTVNRITTAWFEGAQNGAAPSAGQDGSTWNLRNANGSVAYTAGPGGDIGVQIGSLASENFVEGGANNIDVTAEVRNIYKGLVTNNGWAVITSGSFLFTWASSDHATAASRPKLTITYFSNLMEGNSAGSSNAQGSLVGAKRISGTSGGSSQVYARLTRPGSMRGDTNGEATVEGSMRAVGRMHGNADGSSIASATISAVGNAASGNAAGIATVTGKLMGRVRIQGLATANSAALATITMVGLLRGTASGEATVYGRLWGLARGVLSGAFCNPDPLLYITDGTIDEHNGQLHKLDFLEPRNGYLLEDWLPTISQYKEGGYFTDSPSYSGRRLNQRVFENPIEILTLSLRSHTQDSAAEFIRSLLGWQENAADYWTSTWADLPVYMVAKSANETNIRYAIIHMISIPQLKNLYSQPFYSSYMPAMNQLTVRIERGHWMECPPTQFECVAVSSTRSWTVAGWGSSS